VAQSTRVRKQIEGASKGDKPTALSIVGYNKKKKTRSERATLIQITSRRGLKRVRRFGDVA